jgi:hypothetical protein
LVGYNLRIKPGTFKMKRALSQSKLKKRLLRKVSIHLVVREIKGKIFERILSFFNLFELVFGIVGYVFNIMFHFVKFFANFR